MRVKVPKPLHGWREFAGEVGIIVLGVLIALAFQQIADGWEWRDKISRAEGAMRMELADDDGPQAYGRLLIASCLDQQLARIHDGAGKVPPEQLRRWTRDFVPPFRVWDSDAWKVVVASDIGSHLGSDRLIAWSSPYRLMPMLSDADAREAVLVVDLRETIPSGRPSEAELQSVRRIAAQLQVLNRRFRISSQQLLSRIAETHTEVPEKVKRDLLATARSMYGACVSVPKVSSISNPLSADLRSPSLAP